MTTYDLRGALAGTLRDTIEDFDRQVRDAERDPARGMPTANGVIFERRAGNPFDLYLQGDREGLTALLALVERHDP